MYSRCSISYIIIAPSMAAANRFIMPSIGAFSFFTMLFPNFSIRLPKIQAQYILTIRPMLIPTNCARKGVISHPSNITPSKQYICMLNDLNAIRIMLCSLPFLLLPSFGLQAFRYILFKMREFDFAHH